MRSEEGDKNLKMLCVYSLHACVRMHAWSYLCVGEIMEKESNKRSECVCVWRREMEAKTDREREREKKVCVWEGKTVQQRERAIGA